MHQYISGLATFGANVEIGNFTSIFENVVIGDNTRIGSNVIIHRDSIIGKDCVICDNAVIGKYDTRFDITKKIFEAEDRSPSRIGDESLIGTHAIIYRGVALPRRSEIPDQTILKPKPRQCN